jgi:hypothetical protein
MLIDGILFSKPYLIADFGSFETKIGYSTQPEP